MWLSTGVLTALCLVTSLVAAQQELIFATAPTANTQQRNSNTPQELVFTSSTRATENPGDHVFNNFGHSGTPIFSTVPSSNQNSAPVFSSAQFTRSAANSRQSGPPTTNSPQNDNSQSPVFTPSVGSGRSSEASISLSRPPIFSSSSSSAAASRSPTESSDFGDANLRLLSRGAEKFALEYLARISNEHVNAPHRSYMVSPLSVWSLLTLLTEGAQANTLHELRKTLNLEGNTPQSLRSAYRQITKRLNAVTNYVEVASYQALFTDINKPVSRDFEDIIEREYESVLTPVDFADINTTFVQINRDIDVATRGLLPHSVLPQDLIDVHLLMISSLYFKGKWRHPFEEFNTRSVPFYDEMGNVTGNVEMMMQVGNFNYAHMKEMDSHVLELPYGVSNRMSMLVILPKRGISLNNIMNSLRNVGITSILQKLHEDELMALESETPLEVEVFLPKFTTQTHFSIRSILENMGLVDVFQPAFANLSKIAKDVFVSSIFQSTRIIVNEDGTEAAALTIASLTNKASPVRFYFDRPFAYLIVEKTANLLLFAGEVKSHM